MSTACSSRSRRGFAQVPVEHHPRYAGHGNYNLARSLALWSRLATGFSIRPLRLVTWCGLALGTLGGLLAAVVAAYRMLYPERFAAAVAGWASLMVGHLIIGGVQMVFLGILGEYAGRMYTAVAGKKPQATVRAVLNAHAGPPTPTPSAAAAEANEGDGRWPPPGEGPRGWRYGHCRRAWSTRTHSFMSS